MGALVSSHASAVQTSLSLQTSGVRPGAHEVSTQTLVLEHTPATQQSVVQSSPSLQSGTVICAIAATGCAEVGVFVQSNVPRSRLEKSNRTSTGPTSLGWTT